MEKDDCKKLAAGQRNGLDEQMQVQRTEMYYQKRHEANIAAAQRHVGGLK